MGKSPCPEFKDEERLPRQWHGLYCDILPRRAATLTIDLERTAFKISQQLEPLVYRLQPMQF